MTGIDLSDVDRAIEQLEAKKSSGNYSELKILLNFWGYDRG